MLYNNSDITLPRGHLVLRNDKASNIGECVFTDLENQVLEYIISMKKKHIKNKLWSNQVILILQARRRTTTPDDLLYAGDEAVPVLNPVIETPDEPPVILVRENPKEHPPPLQMSMSAPVMNGTDSSLMPPPRSLPVRQTSATR